MLVVSMPAKSIETINEVDIGADRQTFQLPECFEGQRPRRITLIEDCLTALKTEMASVSCDIVRAPFEALRHLRNGLVAISRARPSPWRTASAKLREHGGRRAWTLQEEWFGYRVLLAPSSPHRPAAQQCTMALIT